MKIIKINAMWCPGCLISKSIWSEIESIYPDFDYISLDYDLDEDILNQKNDNNKILIKKLPYLSINIK